MLTRIDIQASDKFNTVQAARALGIDRSTLWRLAKRGVIKAVVDRRTHKSYYRGADLRKFWEQSCI